jgi:hypothetical protein
MRSRVPQVLLWSLVAVLTAVDSASAEEKTSWLSNPFSISSGLESVPGSGGGFSMQGVLLVTPSRISFNQASGRTHWGFGYQPEFEFRTSGTYLSSINHSADANFGHLFSRRTKLDFGHSFVKSSDPARLFSENIFVMPQNGFRENATAMTLSHELAARTTVNLRFDNTLTRMSAGSDVGATVLNQSGIAGTVGISEHLSPRHKITLSYSLLKFRPYRLDSIGDNGQFAANIPMVKAGIALFGAALATAVSRSSPTPTGIAGSNQQAGLSTASTSSPTQPSSVVHTSTSVSAAGAAAEVSAAPVGATVGASVAPATASAAVVVTPANVPLAPSVAAPTINPTLPVVSVVTPPPASTTSSTATCDPKKKDCKKAPEPPKTTITVTKAATSTVTSTASTSTSTASTSPASSSASSTPTGNAATATSSALGSQAPVSTVPQNLEIFGDPFHVLSATYTFTQGPGLLIEVSGGAMHDRDMSYLLGVQVERRVNRLWFAGGFQRFLSYYGTMPFQGSQPVGSIALPNGVAASSVFSAYTGRVGGKLNRRTDLEMSLSVSTSNANFVAHDLQSTIGRARINYWLSNKMSLFADFETFHESGTQVELMHFSRQIFFGGLMVRLSSTPGTGSGSAQKAGN